jgi:hypothetical protein
MYKTQILPVVLYAYETWSLTLRQEHRFRVSENRELKIIFGLKKDEVTGGWRELHNEEFPNFYSSPSIGTMMQSRRMRWPGHGEEGECILVGKPKVKRPLERPTRRWVDNIKMDRRQIGWDDMNWIVVAQVRDQWRDILNTVMNLRVPKIVGNF